MTQKNSLRSLLFLFVPLFVLVLLSCDNGHPLNLSLTRESAAEVTEDLPDEYLVPNVLLVVPARPAPGESFRIVATGGRHLCKAVLRLQGTTQQFDTISSVSGTELPCWRIDAFAACEAGSYNASLLIDNIETTSLRFEIQLPEQVVSNGVVWKTKHGWDTSYETLYSAWVNALFHASAEGSSWSSLHEVMQNRDNNFLYNYLSLNEDNPDSMVKLIMEPDCADNPFFLRAYFAWKLGLPFGYHVCDRGWVGRNPTPGQWITNESSSSKSNPVLAFNAFLRRMMDGVHSGTGRTALSSETSDYYPVALDQSSLRPGTVFADPYGHTFTLVSRLPQKANEAGVLLAVDAQPDKTIAVKRFWKGNFLFNTEGVVGEPGFKAFRPITFSGGKFIQIKNENLNEGSGYVPFSMQQQKMPVEQFYRSMERVINPKPLDPEAALQSLIKALHEQLLVRVRSVANGEKYCKANPGVLVPMPSSANGIFLAGGFWEEYSTPNRDLRLLIAMDEVLGFPERVVAWPEDFGLSKTDNLNAIKSNIQSLLDKTVSELTIKYIRTDGVEQTLSLAEILSRRDAFEMAYNPNDGIEIRWGAPDNSEERLSCKRQVPSHQKTIMLQVRKWFSQRLHPPT